MILGVLTGPTACGKSELAERLAKKYPIKLLSMDSTHVYRYFEIGLAKPSLRHLYLGVDTHHPMNTANVMDFVQTIKNLQAPTLIVGGSYFYLNALLTGLNPLKPLTEEEMEKVRHLSADELQKLIHLHPEISSDPYRRERDLAYLISRGFIPTKEQFEKDRKPVLDSSIPVKELWAPRPITQERAVMRIKRFFESGLLPETRRNMELGFEKSKAMGAIGYKECALFLKDPSYPLERSIKKNTNRLIRMQSTWSTKLNLDRGSAEEIYYFFDHHINQQLSVL